MSIEAFTVVATDAKGHQKRVAVEDMRGARTSLKLHRFAVVGKGDTLEIDPAHLGRFYVVSAEDKNDRIRLTPHFEISTSLRIGESTFPIRIAEICTPGDLESYSYLEAFHYKTSASQFESGDDEKVASETVGGRKAVLLCHLKRGASWDVVAYIELQMPLLMAKPRHILFDRAFVHPNRPITWERWDQYAMQKHVNTIVRIARVVTSPEFRGTGIARLLIGAAKQFSRERWHIGGRRPLFIEISAEMLRYFDFVSSSGLRFAGLTEGNLHRIRKDLQSMQRGYAITSGIMTLQKKYLTRLQSACQRLGRSFESALELLDSVSTEPERLSTLATDDYYLLKTVLRPQIPYHIGGLDDAAERYLEEGLSDGSIGPTASPAQFTAPASRLSIRQLSIEVRYQLPSTPHVRTIMDCFGLKGDELRSMIVQSVDVEASSGNILFISGPSGSGKTALLRALDPNFTSAHVNVRMAPDSERNCSFGWMRELPSDIPIIQYFAERCGVERALAALNQAGLSEAFVYLKPYQLLSRGQQYRAKLADLAVRSEQVWLIDEFGADLDPLTARIVASNLRKHVIRYKRTAIVAAANHDHYLDALKPTRVIRLRHGLRAQVLTYREFLDEFCPKSS